MRLSVLALQTALQEAGKGPLKCHWPNMFQKHCPVEDRPITNQNLYASIKKRLLHLILGKGERTWGLDHNITIYS